MLPQIRRQVFTRTRYTHTLNSTNLKQYIFLNLFRKLCNAEFLLHIVHTFIYSLLSCAFVEIRIGGNRDSETPREAEEECI